MFSQDIIDRFWNKVDKTSSSDGHWLWTAGQDASGYGKFSYQDTSRKKHNIGAHRFAFLLMHGIIPLGMYVLHKPPCVTRHCVFHTYLGTPKDNWADTLSLGREASGDKHGSRTHPERVPRGERVHKAKFTEDDIRLIRILSLEKGPQEIARMFHVMASTISSIQRGKTWKHVPGDIRTDLLGRKGSRHPLALLTEQQVLEIRARYTGKPGEQPVLAQEYGVTRATITAIVRRYTWKHI
jgi:hypothetical protein